MNFITGIIVDITGFRDLDYYFNYYSLLLFTIFTILFLHLLFSMSIIVTVKIM